MQFEWDVSKEIVNVRKHAVDFSEAVEAFFDPKGFVMFDKKHSVHERRFYWVGISGSGRILTTWFTKRGSVIRIIGSAEWRKFRRLYETTQIE